MKIRIWNPIEDLNGVNIIKYVILKSSNRRPIWFVKTGIIK